MPCCARIQMFAVLVIGALGGWLAASGYVTPKDQREVPPGPRAVLLTDAPACSGTGACCGEELYQGMGEVPKFVESFKEFPPRSTPQSFNPANMLEDSMRDIKGRQKLLRAFPMLRPGADQKPKDE